MENVKWVKFYMAYTACHNHFGNDGWKATVSSSHSARHHASFYMSQSHLAWETSAVPRCSKYTFELICTGLLYTTD